MKIGITGSLHWDDKRKIKDIIFKLRSTITDNLEIVTRGQLHGVDFFVKKTCLEMDINIKECLLYHQLWNQHSIEPAYMFNKPYQSKNYFIQNNKFLSYCDMVIVFWKESDNDIKSQSDLIKKINKTNKKHIIIK